jgi:hypothetical protein
MQWRSEERPGPGGDPNPGAVSRGRVKYFLYLVIFVANYRYQR